MATDPQELHAAVVRACKAAGNAAALGRAIGLSKGAVWHWIHRTGRIPAERVGPVSRITGIAPHQLRPDLFDPPPLPPIRSVSVAT